MDLREVLKDVRYRAMTRKPVYQVYDVWNAREQAYDDLMLLTDKLEESLGALEENEELKEKIEDLQWEAAELQTEVDDLQSQLDKTDNEDRDHSPCVCDRDSW